MAKKAQRESKQAPKEDKADRDIAEVRKIHADRVAALRYEGRTETDFVVHGIKDPEDDPNASSDDQDGPALSIRTAGGRVYVKTEGEVVLDQHGFAQVVRQAQTAFQAVS